MPVPKSESRQQAFEIWFENGGNIKLSDLANELGVPDNRVRKWKAIDKWDEKSSGALQNVKRSAPLRRGAPKGNKNAVGHGGPPGNKKAVVTGEFEAIWMDTLDDDEKEMLSRINLDPLVQLDEDIALLVFRERRMMNRIQRLKDGLSEKQRRVLQELKSVKQAVPVYDESTGKSKTVVMAKRELVISEIEETEYRAIDDIVRLEEALTRIQDKKIKAINLKVQLIETMKGPDTVNLLA